MRRRRARLLFLVLVLVVATAGSARAAVLAFTGTLSLQIDPRAVETAVITGSGVASVTDDGSFHLLSFGLASGAFGPFTGTMADIYGSAGPVRLTGVGNLSGSFSGLSGGRLRPA